MRHRASVFVLDGDRALLLHRFKGDKEYYTVPGGGVELGETPEQAAVRELKEETNLDITLGEKIGEFDADDNRQHVYVAVSWSGTPMLGGEELAKQSPTNIYRLEWVPVGTLSMLDVQNVARELLLQYLKS